MKTIINSTIKMFKAIKNFLYTCRKNNGKGIQKGFAFAD